MKIKTYEIRENRVLTYNKKKDVIIQYVIRRWEKKQYLLRLVRRRFVSTLDEVDDQLFILPLTMVVE